MTERVLKDRCTVEGCRKGRRGPRFCHKHSSKCGRCGGVLHQGTCCKHCTTSEWTTAISKWRREVRPVTPTIPCPTNCAPLSVAASVAAFGRIWLSVPQILPTVDFTHSDPASLDRIKVDFPGGRASGPLNGLYKLRYRGAPAIGLLVHTAGKIPCAHLNESACLLLNAKGRYRDNFLIKRLLALECDRTRKIVRDLATTSKVSTN